MSTEKIRFLSFTVEGRGAFPLDMLRYDHCWPATQDDVARVVLSHVEREKRSIRLTGFTYGSGDTGGVTPERWASFGWKVTEVTYR